MPGLVRRGHFSSGQGFQVRSGWPGQGRSRGSDHVKSILQGQVNQLSSVW